MRTQITEIIKNNYAVDFTGAGMIMQDMTAEELQMMIESDIINSYDCITYLSSLVKVKESMNLDEPTHLSVHLYMKVLSCEERDSMLQVISSYITKTFLN